MRSGRNLVVTLVSAENPSQYCQAQFSIVNGRGYTAEYMEAKLAITHGRRFVMSEVRFAEGVKASYVSCPQKLVVDLKATNMDICAHISNSAVQPVPTTTLASSTALAPTQFFDIVAVIRKVHNIEIYANHKSFCVEICDGTVDPDTKQLNILPLRLCSRLGGRMLLEDMKTFADQHLHSRSAVSFFCIASRRQLVSGKTILLNTNHTFITGGVCKCRLCGRVGNGSCMLDGRGGGLICSGENSRYHCHTRLSSGDTANQIMTEALQQILGDGFTRKWPPLASLLAPFFVKDHS